MHGAQPINNVLIKHFQVTHKHGYLIDQLTSWQLLAMENLLKCRRGDVPADYVIEQALVLLDTDQ